MQTAISVVATNKPISVHVAYDLSLLAGLALQLSSEERACGSSCPGGNRSTTQACLTVSPSSRCCACVLCCWLLLQLSFEETRE